MSVKHMRFYVFSIGQSVLTSVGLTDLRCAGLGFILGLFISSLLTRTDKGQKKEAHQSEDKLAAELAEKVKVLCWVMTGPTNHQAKVRKVSCFQSLVCCVYRPDT